MGSDLQTRYRNGRLLVGDRWVTYPFKPRELAKSMPAVPMARAAFDALATTWRGKKQIAAADSYAELMRAGFGPTMYKQVYEPYAAKLWGVSGEDIDIDQARRKAGSQTMWGALVRSVRNSIASESLAYLYPRRGFGQLCEVLADAAMEAGARIRLGAAAEHLAVDADGRQREPGPLGVPRLGGRARRLVGGAALGRRRLGHPGRPRLLDHPGPAAGPPDLAGRAVRGRGGQRQAALPRDPAGVRGARRRPLDRLRRPLHPGRRHPGHPHLRAGEPPLLAGRPDRAHRAVLRDPLRHRRRSVGRGRGSAREPGPRDGAPPRACRS